MLAVELRSENAWTIDMTLDDFITELVMEHEWTCSISEVRHILSLDTNLQACPMILQSPVLTSDLLSCAAHCNNLVHCLNNSPHEV